MQAGCARLKFALVAQHRLALADKIAVKNHRVYKQLMKIQVLIRQIPFAQQWFQVRQMLAQSWWEVSQRFDL